MSSWMLLWPICMYICVEWCLNSSGQQLLQDCCLLCIRYIPNQYVNVYSITCALWSGWIYTIPRPIYFQWWCGSLIVHACCVLVLQARATGTWQSLSVYITHMKLERKSCKHCGQCLWGTAHNAYSSSWVNYNLLELLLEDVERMCLHS